MRFTNLAVETLVVVSTVAPVSVRGIEYTSPEHVFSMDDGKNLEKNIS